MADPLQAQLALQTELCQQYEIDLQSRDELVQILGLRDEQLGTWKKKVQELERTCRIAQLDLEEQLRRRDAEAEMLRQDASNLCRENTRTIDQLKRALEEAEAVVRQLELESRSLTDKINALKEEVEQQRRRIQVLQQESADKEVKLVQLNKQHQRDKEDLEGMNTALDSKQMELELLKRKLGIRGTAGATPAPTTSRRDSAIFSTPTASSA